MGHINHVAGHTGNGVNISGPGSGQGEVSGLVEQELGVTHCHCPAGATIELDRCRICHQVGLIKPFLVNSQGFAIVLIVSVPICDLNRVGAVHHRQPLFGERVVADIAHGEEEPLNRDIRLINRYGEFAAALDNLPPPHQRDGIHRLLE